MSQKKVKLMRTLCSEVNLALNKELKRRLSKFHPNEIERDIYLIRKEREKNEKH